MTGFRTSKKSEPGSPQGILVSSPFSQAQILHLMKTEFARARRYGFPVSCMLVAVDRLRSLTDLHGGELRDKVRAALVRLIADKTRDADHLGLLSEDRLVLVLPHTDAGAATAVGERLREAFRDLEVKVGGSALDLTLSLGVACCADQDTLFFDTMLSRAEVALSWAEDAGGNQVAVYRGRE